MKAKRLSNFGIPKGTCFDLGVEVIKKTGQLRLDDRDTEKDLRALVKDPAAFMDHEIYGALAEAVKAEFAAGPGYIPRDAPAPYRIWGEGLESGALQQMANAANIPVAVSGALMPDAHPGYGLPIGGVLATENAVIPYAVGVDIACRMKLTVLDMPPSHIERKEDKLIKAIAKETRFGMGSHFKDRRAHDVMDLDWSVTETTREIKDKAWAQLGTSGSGNHFVEFGTLTLEQADLGLEAGTYLALLSHSGSRGAGATVAGFYSRLAQSLHTNLPRELRHLAWLEMDSEAGQAYWAAMILMGEYAAANHACIHRHVADHLGVEVLLDVENAGGRRRIGDHSRIHGRPRIYRARKRPGGKPEQRLARSRSPHESNRREREVRLAQGEQAPERATREADLRRPGRSSRCLQGHPRGHGPADGPGGYHRPLRPAPGEDGRGR
ncbi:MAG: tRNA-splicing ligase RtcB [Verrucomicrobiales bacterium]|jgi:tRNA-splicing ligase RtcB